MPTQSEREPQQQKLTSIEHGSFDTAALQQELAQALEEDRKYKLTDNAKKRAIHTATNYDEFKNLVACADLKPISQRELRSFSNGERSMNLSYKKPKSRRVYGSNLQLKTEKTDQPPASAVEFARQWRRHLKTTDEKYSYLRLTTPERLETLFKADVDADLMAEIARVTLTVWKQLQEAEHIQDHAAFARGTLHAFTQAGRFSLILDFLDNNQIEVFRDLFVLLEAQTAEGDSKDREELQTLKTLYKLEG